jgi:bacteriocin-like protein
MKELTTFEMRNIEGGVYQITIRILIEIIKNAGSIWA